jgi:mevalonate kinase
MSTASTPGKIILFGEHAVVYGQPALAVPVNQVQATASIPPLPSGEGPGVREKGQIWIKARQLRRRYTLSAADVNDPLALAVRLALQHCNVEAAAVSFKLDISSTIPRASGLGSGAAVCTAIVRAVAAHFNSPITNSQVSAIVFETEKLLHGTPSGIDNTVIAYNQPVWFIKGQPPEPFTVAQPFSLLIADTGIASPTKIAVGDVRAAWQREPEKYNALFQEIGALAREAREIIVGADGRPPLPDLGQLMNRNHALLREINVSSEALENLVEAATQAGALGAKLSGGGRGGNMLALVTPETSAQVEAALKQAGAARVLSTAVSSEQ